MKSKLLLSSVILIGLILGSCATSNTVGGGGIFQKRKYNKGFYWNRNQSDKEVSENADSKLKSDLSKESNEVSNSSNEENVAEVEYTNESQNNFDVASVGDEINVTESAQRNEKLEFSLNKASLETIKKVNIGKKIGDKLLAKKSMNSPAPGSSGNTTNILMLILLIVLIIIVFALLNELLGGLLSWILGIIILVLIIYFLLRLLGLI